MKAWSEFHDHPIYGWGGGDDGIPASWRIDCEEYPAEGHPDCPSAGTETEMRATLLKWGSGKTRAEAVQLFGADAVRSQERWVADVFWA